MDKWQIEYKTVGFHIPRAGSENITGKSFGAIYDAFFAIVERHPDVLTLLEKEHPIALQLIEWMERK